MNTSLRKGLRFEEQARCYLAARGLQFVQSNYRCRFGEVDLIMRDGDTLCFIEVRYRNSSDFGGAAASITPAKQRRIVKSALFYLSSKAQPMRNPLRFDALILQQRAGGIEFDWIKNAFYGE